MHELEREGRYRVLRTLGEGAQGQVVLAWDEASHREVAVKVFTAGDRLSRARFAREFTALSRVRHPNVVQVFEVREGPGLCFYTMEFVAGRDLGSLMADRALEPLAALRLLVAVAGGLQAVHDAGLVHRDVKPANVLVAADGVPRLADFGLVRDVDALRTRLTRSGFLVGTLQYLPPEVLRGEPHEARGDVFALAVTTYQALCGALPFDVPSLLAIARGDAPAPPPPLSTRWPGADASLDALVGRALADDPRRRTATVAELRSGLEAWLAAPRAAVAVPASAPAAPAGGPRRLLGGLIVGLALAAALLGWAALRRPAPEEAAPPPAPPGPTELLARYETELEAFLERPETPVRSPFLTHPPLRLPPAAARALVLASLGRLSLGDLPWHGTGLSAEEILCIVDRTRQRQLPWLDLEDPRRCWRQFLGLVELFVRLPPGAAGTADEDHLAWVRLLEDVTESLAACERWQGAQALVPPGLPDAPGPVLAELERRYGVLSDVPDVRRAAFRAFPDVDLPLRAQGERDLGELLRERAARSSSHPLLRARALAAPRGPGEPDRAAALAALVAELRAALSTGGPHAADVLAEVEALHALALSSSDDRAELREAATALWRERGPWVDGEAPRRLRLAIRVRLFTVRRLLEIGIKTAGILDLGYTAQGVREAEALLADCPEPRYDRYVRDEVLRLLARAAPAEAARLARSRQR